MTRPTSSCSTSGLNSLSRLPMAAWMSSGRMVSSAIRSPSPRRSGERSAACEPELVPEQVELVADGPVDDDVAHPHEEPSDHARITDHLDRNILARRGRQGSGQPPGLVLVQGDGAVDLGDLTPALLLRHPG